MSRNYILSPSSWNQQAGYWLKKVTGFCKQLFELDHDWIMFELDKRWKYSFKLYVINYS